MIERVLLAVDDSPDSLAAARLSVELAGKLPARLRVVSVSANHAVEAAIEAATNRPEVDVRRSLSAVAILARVTALAEVAGVTVETDLLTGDVGPAVLDAARAWSADLVIVGRAGRRKSGEPYVGAQTRHVLEFAEQPVLVVPSGHR